MIKETQAFAQDCDKVVRGSLMKNLLLVLLFSLVTLSTYARKPAVEDFIGVEPESYKTTPPGTETLFNFEQNVQALAPESFAEGATFQSSWFGLVVIGAFILLPAFMWFGLTRNNPQESSQNSQDSMDQKDQNNVHVLEDYRETEEEQNKKAS